MEIFCHWFYWNGEQLVCFLKSAEQNTTSSCGNKTHVRTVKHWLSSSSALISCDEDATCRWTRECLLLCHDVHWSLGRWLVSIFVLRLVSCLICSHKKWGTSTRSHSSAASIISSGWEKGKFDSWQWNKVNKHIDLVQIQSGWLS